MIGPNSSFTRVLNKLEKCCQNCSLPSWNARSQVRAPLPTKFFCHCFESLKLCLFWTGCDQWECNLFGIFTSEIKASFQYFLKVANSCLRGKNNKSLIKQKERERKANWKVTRFQLLLLLFRRRLFSVSRSVAKVSVSWQFREIKIRRCLPFCYNGTQPGLARFPSVDAIYSRLLGCEGGGLCLLNPYTLSLLCLELLG